MSDTARIVTEHDAEIRAAVHWHRTAPETLHLWCAHSASKVTHRKSLWQVGVYLCNGCNAKQRVPWK